jgi:hypothetical protein
MRLFSKCLLRDSSVWFKGLKVDFIFSWTNFSNAFLYYWGENKSLDSYLSDFCVLRRVEDKALSIFNKKFYIIYHEIYIIFWQDNESPLEKKHPFIFHRPLGSNMTLGICSFYIELCPPLFGYSSKHMESLFCLLHCELMSMSCCLSQIIFHDFFQGNFHPT